MKVLITLLSLIFSFVAFSQHVGINQNTPTNSLHISPFSVGDNPLRIDDLQPYTIGDTSLLIINKSTGVVKYINTSDFVSIISSGLITDYQDIDSLILTGYNLETFISNGNSAAVDLSPLADSISNYILTNSDFTNQVISILYNNSDTLLYNTNFINNLRDSIDTDVDSLILTNTILTIYENGTGISVDLSSICPIPAGGTNGQVLSTDGNGVYTWVNDNSGTDNQNITGSSFNAATGNLVIGIQNGTSQTVNFNGLKDHDWYEVGGTNAPNNINDNIYTQGRVGIGTIAPSSKLEIVENTTQTALTVQKDFTGLANTNAAFIGGIDFGYTSSGIYVLEKDNTSFSGVNTNTFNVVNNSISQFVVKGAGNVGIGTVNPIEKLTVNGNVKIGLTNTGSIQPAGYGNSIIFSGAPVVSATFDGENSDPISIARYNVAHDQSELRIILGDNSQVGDAFVIGYGNYNSVYRFETAGVATKPGGGAWAATSDKRTKKDIVEFSDGLNVLNKINPVTFKYNGLYNTNNDGKDYVGIIAQEVKEVAPYMIGSYNATMTPETSVKEEILNYDGGTYMLYVLVNSVKEQQLQIEALQQSNNLLIEELKSLKK